MKVFVTGASGFVGSAVVRSLIDSGHQVTGLARNEDSAKKIADAGAEVLMGDLENPDSLRQGALSADGIIHTAFIHDFSQYARANDVEKAAIDVMAEAITGTNKPLVVTAGILWLPLIDGVITEDSRAKHIARSSETTAMAWAQRGVNASVVRLAPSVHDKGDKGFIPFIIQQARKYGVSAYPGDGSNRWPAVHRLDAAKVFQLAVERSSPGALYNAIADSGIPLKEIAALIGEELGLPVASVSGDELTRHFEWMNMFIGVDAPSSASKTQNDLGWQPTQTGLLEDMRKNYF